MCCASHVHKSGCDKMLYKLQDHVMDLKHPNSTGDALLVIAGRDDVPATIQIPKNIPKADLLKLMPLTWLTNYEKEHTTSRPVDTTTTPKEEVF